MLTRCYLLQTPWTNPVSAERPLIDMATPVSERGAQVKQLTDAFDSVPVAKKSRLSVATTNNDTASLLGGDDDGTDSLLNADEVCNSKTGARNSPRNNYGEPLLHVLFLLTLPVSGFRRVTPLELKF